MPCLWKCILPAGLLCWCTAVAWAADPVPLPGLAQDGEEAPAVLVPLQPRDEADRDRLKASALFAQARLLYQREDLAGALRRYERAYRYDPAAKLALAEIVSIAFELEHEDEATRYAILAGEQDPRDPLLLRRLAMHLTEEQDYARALKLYEKSFELRKDANDSTAIFLHLEVGRLNFLEGNFVAAAASFERVREALADPKKFELSEELQKIVLGNAQTTYSLLGESFLQAERYDHAETMFRKAHESKPDEARLAFMLARIRAKQKRHDEALQELNTYFATSGAKAGVEPYQLLGEVLAAQLGNAEQAQAATLDKLAELYAKTPDYLPLAVAYGRALRKAKKPAEAITVLEKSLELDVSAEAAETLVDLYREAQQPDKLLTVLRKSVGKTGALSSIGEAGQQLAKDKELVAQLIAIARANREKLMGISFEGEALAIALLAMQARDFDAGDEFYALAVEHPPASRNKIPKSEVLIAWGLELFQAEQYERAARVFQSAIDKKLTGDRKELMYYFLAGALAMQNKTDEALVVIDQALTSEKPSLRLLGRKAWILYHAKRYAEAEKEYQAILAKHDSDHKANDTRESLREARLVLSNICVQTDRFAEGVEWLEQVLDEFPEDVGAHNDLGYLWTERGQHLNRALRMTQFAVAKEPDNTAYRDSLGWAYYQLGRYAEAIVELEKAANVDEPDGVILDHLADAYAKQQMLEKATATYQKAIAAFEKEQETDKLQATRDKLTKLNSK